MLIHTSILQPEVQDFITTHENADIAQLVLKGSPFNAIDIQSLAQQIKGRQVAKDKFPDLYAHQHIIYPPRLNLEQASSQITANYKAQFFNTDDAVIDLTGGFGIDSLAFTTTAKEVSYCEIQPETFEYAQHNFKVLDKNISTHCGHGIRFLSQTSKSFDWIYIDPARRDKHVRKVFRLEDCTPNILEHLELFKSKSKQLLLKASPLLDLNLCIKQIPYITDIHIVAVKNEVKELLLVIDFERAESTPNLRAVNLCTPQQAFCANYEKRHLEQAVSEPLTYLYEPNSAIMKSGLFGELCRQYKVKALAKDSHLFTADKCIDFPGRRFEITAVISPKKQLLKQYIPDLKANVSCRNYPLKPVQLKTKYNLKDGGETYIFFSTNFKNEKIVLICNKIRL